MTLTDAPAVPTRRVLGFELVDLSDLDRLVWALSAPAPADGRLPLLATPNVDDLVRLARPEHADLADLLRRARYLLPDGQPVVWASRLLGSPLRARLAGADLLPRWWRELASHARPTLVVAPTRAVAEALVDRHPRLVTVVAPMLDAADPDSIRGLADEVAQSVARQGTEVLLVGIGFPHQQRLAARLFDLLPEPTPFIGLLGGSFDLFTGRTLRAPRWMRRSGLEWAYRLWREPRRLARRYLIDDLAFVPMVWRAWRRTRLDRKGRP